MTGFPPTHRPARDIPVPTSISPEAQAVLAMGRFAPDGGFPDYDDIAGWQAHRARADGATLVAISLPGSALAEIVARGDTRVEDVDLGAFKVYRITPPGLPAGDRRAYLEIHGSFVATGGEVCRTFSQQSANGYGVETWTVDYRMPPEHRYPAALDDCLAAYRHLLETRGPEDIAVGGASAGGNLASALMLRLKEEGLPLPAALSLETPLTDMTMASDSWQTLFRLDPIIADDLSPVSACYTGPGVDLRDPHLSPVYADLSGFPPTILTTGTRDALLSDTVRMHRALLHAGVEAELHVWEAAGHAMFLGTAPEDADKTRQIRTFLDRHWQR